MIAYWFSISPAGARETSATVRMTHRRGHSCADPGHLHRSRDARAGAVLHQHRPAGLRADQSARNGQGRAVRALLAIGEVAAAAVPGRVPRRGRFARRRRRRQRGRCRARRQALRARVQRVRRRFGRAARRRAHRLRRRLERPDEGARVGPPDGVPRAVDAIRALHRSAERPLEVPRARRGRALAARGGVHADAGRRVRDLRAVDPGDGSALPGAVSEIAGGFRRASTGR